MKTTSQQLRKDTPHAHKSLRPTRRRQRRPARRSTVEPLEPRLPFSVAPFDWTSTYLGTDIQRGGATKADLQPSIMYDLSDRRDDNNNGIPDRLFKMWWLGHFDGEPGEKAPSNLDAGDRILFSHSENGSNWSSPEVVLKGQGGIGGNITADDHLLGSPSVIKLDETYYMFYEAYGTWSTVINRFYSFDKGDTWTTSGVRTGMDWDDSYDSNYPLGFAPYLVKAGTHPVYTGEVTYNLNGQEKVNRYLSLSKISTLHDSVGNPQRPLGNPPPPLFDDTPEFWLYDADGPGREPIYLWFDTQFSNTFVTRGPNSDDPIAWRVNGGDSTVVPADADPTTPGVQNLLGYVASSLDGPDMIGSLQNRIMMATSTDGVNWTRFQGPARGGAVIAPQNELTAAQGYDLAKARAGLPAHASTLANERFDILRHYGAGFPSATVRDGQLELYFTDAVRQFTPYEVDPDPNKPRGEQPRRILMPIGSIDDPAAWTAARAPNTLSLSQFAGSGSDIKWSPLHQRYFVAYQLAGTTAPTILWSDFDPAPDVPAFGPDDKNLGPLATNYPDGSPGRYGGHGGLLGDELGQTVDFTEPYPYSALHLYYASWPQGPYSNGATDLDHIYVAASIPTLSISDASANEADSYIDFTVTLSAASAFDVEVDYSTQDLTATADSDYYVASGRVRFSPGQTSKTIRVNLNDDAVFEGDERFELALSRPDSSHLLRSTAVGLIREDDAHPALSVNDVVVDEGGTAQLTVELAASTVSDVTASYATLPGSATSADFTPRTGTIRIPAGSVRASVTIPTINDDIDEFDELFTLRLSNLRNATVGDNEGSITIRDNDAASAVSVHQTTCFEGDDQQSTCQVRVSLSKPSGKEIEVDYAAHHGAIDDYHLEAGTLTFAPGDTERRIAVGIVGDTVDGLDNAVQLSIGIPVNATRDRHSAQVIILDDDAPDVSVETNFTSIDGISTTIDPSRETYGDVDVERIHIADFNGDGKDDVYYLDGFADNDLYFLDDEDEFHRVSGGIGWSGSKFDINRFRYGDFDGDGKTDVYVVYGWNEDDAVDRIYLSNGDGTYRGFVDGIQHAVGVHPDAEVDLRRLKFGDFDGDGKTDIYYVIGDVSPVRDRIFLSNGDGSYREIDGLMTSLEYLPEADVGRFKLADFDGDGKTDIYYFEGWDARTVDNIYLSNGDGTFRTTNGFKTKTNSVLYRLTEATHRFADLNGDGRSDVVEVRGWGDSADYVYFTSEEGLRESPIRGLHTPIRTTHGQNAFKDMERVRFGDFNGDGIDDIYYIQGWDAEAPDKVFISNGNGTFEQYETPYSTWGGQVADYDSLKFGDFNGDGKTDVYQIRHGTDVIDRVHFSTIPGPTLSVSNAILTMPAIDTVTFAFDVELSSESGYQVDVAYEIYAAGAVLSDELVADGTTTLARGTTRQAATSQVAFSHLPDVTDKMWVRLVSPRNATFPNGANAFDSGAIGFDLDELWMDVNLDGVIGPGDALQVINELNRTGGGETAGTPSLIRKDISRDGYLAPLDALILINRINFGASSGSGDGTQDPSLGGEGEDYGKAMGRQVSAMQLMRSTTRLQRPSNSGEFAESDLLKPSVGKRDVTIRGWLAAGIGQVAQPPYSSRPIGDVSRIDDVDRSYEELLELLAEDIAEHQLAGSL